MTGERDHFQAKSERSKTKTQTLRAEKKKTQLEAQLAALQAQQGQAAGDAQVLTQQIAALTGERDAARAEKTQLEAQLAALQAQQGQAAGDAQVLTQQIAALTGERDAARAEKDQLDAQLAALQAQQGQAAGDAQVLTRQIAALTGERDAARAEKDQLDAQLTALQAQQGQAAGDAQVLTQQIAALTGERDAARAGKDQLDAQLTALQEQQAQLPEVLGRLDTYTTKIAELEQDLATRQRLSQELEEAYRQENQSKAEKISELEVRHQGDLLLITQLQEQVSRLQEAQHAGFSAPRVVPEQQASENTLQPPLGAPPPPPPPMPTVREDSAAKPKPGKKQASSETQTSSSTQQRPSPVDLTTARLKPQNEQKPLAAPKAPKLTLLDQIRGRGTHKPKSPLSADEQIKLAQIKKEITDGKYVSIFWKPEESPSTQNTSSEAPSMFDALKSAMDSRRVGLAKPDDDTSSDGEGWSDSDDDVASRAAPHQSDVPTEVLKQLSTIRQIYREALEIGYEDEAKTTKWTTDRWLLWENKFYKTAGQRSSVDKTIETYIKDNIDDLQNRFGNVNFESIVHKDGAPMATHSTGDGQDPLLQSVVFPSKKE